MKKKLKRFIEKVSNEFPNAIYKADPPVRITVLGSSLIEKGVTTIKGKKVNRKGRYSHTIEFPKISHYQKLKKFKKEHGDDFLIEYARWLKRHMKMMYDKYPEQFKAREPIDGSSEEE